MADAAGEAVAGFLIEIVPAVAEEAVAAEQHVRPDR